MSPRALFGGLCACVAVGSAVATVRYARDRADAGGAEFALLDRLDAQARTLDQTFSAEESALRKLALEPTLSVAAGAKDAVATERALTDALTNLGMATALCAFDGMGEPLAAAGQPMSAACERLALGTSVGGPRANVSVGVPLPRGGALVATVDPTALLALLRGSELLTASEHTLGAPDRVPAVQATHWRESGRFGGAQRVGHRELWVRGEIRTPSPRGLYPWAGAVLALVAFAGARRLRASHPDGGNPPPKTGFLAKMSHELRAPLNAVIGFSDLLISGAIGPINSEQRQALRDIQAAGNHQLALINDILDLAKLDAGALRFELDDLPLDAPAHQAAEMVRSIAERKGVALEVQFEPELSCRGDLLRLRQIALNLLSNALKFTPAGGRVVLATRASADGAWAELAVRDTGIGIAPAHHRMIFEEFRQVPARHHPKTEGTGLGLALVKKFTEAMGGSVIVESELGQGATFTVRLPKAACTAMGRAA